MRLKHASTALLWLGFLGILLAIAGIPNELKEGGFLLVGALTIALGIWLRLRLPPPRRREAQAFAEARPRRARPKTARDGTRLHERAEPSLAERPSDTPPSSSDASDREHQ